MKVWQREYAIEDTFAAGEKWVFVPDSPACVCKLFRVQHDSEDPTHELAQINERKCVLCPLRALKKGEELTFDYFGEDTDIVSSASAHDSSTEYSQSLSSSADSSAQVVLTGIGTQTEGRLLATLESRVKALHGAEVAEDLAF